MTRHSKLGFIVPPRNGEPKNSVQNKTYFNLSFSFQKNRKNILTLRRPTCQNWQIKVVSALTAQRELLCQKGDI